MVDEDFEEKGKKKKIGTRSIKKPIIIGASDKMPILDNLLRGGKGNIDNKK